MGGALYKCKESGVRKPTGYHSKLLGLSCCSLIFIGTGNSGNLTATCLQEQQPALSRGSFSSEHEGVNNLRILSNYAKSHSFFRYPKIWTGKDFPSPRNAYELGSKHNETMQLQKFLRPETLHLSSLLAPYCTRLEKGECHSSGGWMFIGLNWLCPFPLCCQWLVETEEIIAF